MKYLPWALLLLLVSGCSLSSVPVSAVKLTPLEDRVRVEIGGQLFTEYFF
ncbi:MAG: hypothetical protein JNK23_17990 [Opitutaceae bacterium]|nr:hypothetical protein [Opitutaceae bacterium]